MGLDLVELVMEVEDAFDIEIPDDRTGEMQTVGGLYDFIVETKGEALSARNTCQPRNWVILSSASITA